VLGQQLVGAGEHGGESVASRTSSDGGAGLGLAIVRGIVEAHGGRVEAHHGAGGVQLDLILPTETPAARAIGRR